MFFAKNLKPGEVVEISSSTGAEVLHLSQVCMSKANDANRTYLKIFQGAESFAACVLQRDRQESSGLDLFLSTHEGLKLGVEGGKNELSVVGYFEPEADESGSDDDEDGVFGEDSEEESEVSDDETAGMTAPVMRGGRIEDLDALEEEEKKKRQQGNKKALKALQAAAADDDESADEDEDADSNDGPEAASSGEDEDEDDEDSDDEEEAEEEKPAPPQQKRKGNQQQPQAQQNKKAKTQGSTGKADEAAYKAALVEFLKKNGRTPLASLGQKVKKPAGVEMKMATFLKASPDVFVVDSGFCALK